MSDNPHRYQIYFEDQQELLVSECHCRCIRATERYLTLAIAVIENKEFMPVLHKKMWEKNYNLFKLLYRCQEF